MRVLVVWEGGVRSADGDGEQEHVFGVRLASQGGEKILCFLWGGTDGLKRNVSVNDSQFKEAPPPPLQGCPGPPHLPEKERWMWGWVKVTESTPSGVFYLLLLFCSASFLSFLFRLFLSSRLLWVLRCNLHLTRFRGCFQRGGFSGGFFFPLPFLSLFPLLLLILGGTSRLKKEVHLLFLRRAGATPSFILTASSCIISSLSSSSWSLYFSLIFFNLFWRDEKDRPKNQIMSDAK